MADKELTVFLVDAAAPSSSYDYVFDTLAGKLLKGLKTDYVSVASFNSASTNHAHAHTGKFRGIEVLLDFKTISFESLRMLNNSLRSSQVLNPNPAPDSADVVQAVLFASTLFGPTKKKVFTRNVVVIHGENSTIHSDSAAKIASLPTFFSDYRANCYFIISPANGHELNPIHPTIQGLLSQFPHGIAFSTVDATELMRNRNPRKKTKPVAAYKGELRFGADFDRITHDTSYFPSQDSTCCTFDVEMYPVAKSDSSSLKVHEYIIDEDQIVRVSNKTTHFVWSDKPHDEEDDLEIQGRKILDDDPDGDPSREKQIVDSNSTMPAFKFSNYDLIALDSDLKEATKLHISPGFDIFAFIPADSIPYSFFTDEAFYVIPQKSSKVRNLLAFNAFTDAITRNKLAALCRLVRKQQSEVEVGAAFPVKIKFDSAVTNCLVFIRLPFKEDEKIGKFPKLAAGQSQDADINSNEDTDVEILMDKFVECKTYMENKKPSEINHEPVINNYKVSMRDSESSKLILPSNFETTDPFLCSSPAEKRFQVYIRRILLKSLEADDWIAFFQNPDFIKENLRTMRDDFTNFFNIRNCLAVDSSQKDKNWLEGLCRNAEALSESLKRKLDVKYVKKDVHKRQHTSKDQSQYQKKGHYGDDEGNYAEVPDFGLDD